MDLPPDLPRATLVARQTHRCLHGHPWVFRSELELPSALPNASPIAIFDRKQLIGIGLYSEKSQIAVRLFSRRPVLIDASFLRRRIQDAIALRDQRMPGRPARRLVSSEADLLPGLIVDQYGDRLVVQATTAGIDARLDVILDILDDLLHPRQIVERNDLAIRDLEGLPRRAGVLRGPPDTTVTVAIGRLICDLDLLDPHKTGTYLDQQVAHEDLMGRINPGDRILDVCCHLGGFAIHGLLAGAREAVAIDQASASVRGAEAAARRAGVADRLHTIEADAFKWLADPANREQRFDVVVLDPPSFTRNRAGVPAALSGYRELHRRGLQRLGIGGRLLTFSCSHHINREDFLGTILEAAADTRRSLRLDAWLGASPDHPILPGVPESEYLKGLALTVIDGPDGH